MTAHELHRQHPSLEFAPILRVIKYMGFDSAELSPDQVDLILRLYPDFECDPELVVGTEAVCRLVELEAERLAEILKTHRHRIPYLGTHAHPMVPTAALDIIRAIAANRDPFPPSDERLFTLTEMAELTEISLASLSKYLKEQPDRIPTRTVGKMRKFPVEAIGAFQQIKLENLSKRGNGKERAERQKAALRRRYAAKFAELETQLEAAIETSKDLSRTLKRLSRQVRRARASAESATRVANDKQPGRPRRSGGRRPDTIVAACKKVLAEARGPMRVADITERVVAMGTPIRAKNPNVTVSSILSSYDDFGRVRRGYYELLRNDTADEPPSEETDAGSATATSALEKAVATTLDQDAGDVLAGLRAAADSAEEVAEAADDAAELDVEAYEPAR